MDEDKQKYQQKFFDSLFPQSFNSPAKAIGLRSLGNVLRGLGELDLSNYVLLRSLEKTQPQEQESIWFDLGNTRRALSNKEQDLYNRSEKEQDIICAIVYAYAATNAYEKAIAAPTSDISSLIKIQAQLNKLNLFLDLRDKKSNFEQLLKQQKN